MIPHAYATAESNIDSLLGLRKQLKLSGINVSVNDFIIKAVAIALKQCPLVNCHYVKDKVIDYNYNLSKNVLFTMVYFIIISR
jgi:pyruvate dehydrogenase E2 component (dihydrolipoamide acetyltransferase)